LLLFIYRVAIFRELAIIASQGNKYERLLNKGFEGRSMKKLQCTDCNLVFWREVDLVGDQVVDSGEWIQLECPQCGEEWVVYEPKTKARRKPARATKKRRIQRKRAAAGRMKKAKAVKAAPKGGKGPRLTPSGIRSLRKKLGVSQRELANLMGVTMGAVALWEKGTFKPKEEKLTKLMELRKLGKKQVKEMLAGKESKG
jgi:DNA-binding transcriptional regulator YiaG